MKCKYLLVVLFFFAAINTDAQLTRPYNFDNYVETQTWGPWKHLLYERYYYDKLFYIPLSGDAKQFYLMDQTGSAAGGVDYDQNSCYDGTTDWHFKIYYTLPTGDYYSIKYTPQTVGTTNVKMTISYWWEGGCGDHDAGPAPTTNYANFNITVEKPDWKANKSELQNICQSNGVTYNLADYFNVSNALFNIDHRGDTTWSFPDFPVLTRAYQISHGLYYLQYPEIWIRDDYDQAGGHWETDYSAIPDTILNYPDLPNYSADYQREHGLFTSYPVYVTSFNPASLSPGVHTILGMKYYDNAVDDGAYGSHRGRVEIPTTITILPGAPTVGNVAFTNSCPGTPTGTITITGVNGGNGNYRYILRNGLNNSDACDPDAGGSCFNIQGKGSFTGAATTINSVPDGDYTLWIANNGGTTGACARTYNISIGKLSQMDTLPITIQHISCPGGSNGLVKVTDTGGLKPYTFTLTTASGAVTNSTGEFANLLSGSYVMNTKDGCGYAVQRTIVLTEPLPVAVTATASATDCNTPANGAIDITASGGSGTFNYYLYDSTGKTVAQQTNSTATTWSLGAIGAGKYTVAVANTAAATCTATTKTVVVAGPPDLTLGYVSQTNNKCWYDALGALQLTGGGGQENGYIYYLQNNTTGVVLQSTTGNFSALPVASYKAWIRNRDLSCNDSTIYAATLAITAPPALVANATATDITCNGNGNGILTTTVTGGTPAYGLQWQQWNEASASWGTMSGKVGASETGLQKGTYRVQILDDNNCTIASNQVVIAEPDELLITSVDRNDIVCYGGTGTITMHVTGGNTNYVYELSTDGGNNWNAFTATTPLTAATYQLKVHDNKACETSYNNTVAITTPDQPLAIDYTLTDYNGFNVPCYGTDRGVVKVSATGGNGSTYSGYTFTVDAGSYTSSNVLSTNAGSHTFYVQDARGCIVGATATLTQPASEMKTVVSNKVNNDCAEGSAAAVTVTTTGGTPKYNFSINGTDYQALPTFGSLPSGTYQVSVRDINGCADSVGVTLIDLNTPIVDHIAINNVSCYEGSDGRITLSPTGGVPLYSYTWREHSSVEQVLDGLKTGNYYVTITDSKGCAVEDSFTVTQPLHPLSATVYTRPVCVNNPYGNVQFTAQGGTTPYTYSIDGGANYNSNALFPNILANSYAVAVKDANGCDWSGTAAVTVNSINPELNFLVSTRQNALDTLQIKEICIPKPDSIQWTFDPRTIVLSNDMFNPQVRYNNEGSYLVNMKAWFGGCDFDISKTIAINPYDPDVVNNYNSLYGIDTVVVASNPNNGNFTLQVKLFKKQRLHVSIYTVTGAVLWNKQWDYTNQVQEAISLTSNVANGLVFIKVLTDDDVRDVQMLISK